MWLLLGDPYDPPAAFEGWTRLESLVLDGALPFAVRAGGTEVVLDLSATELHAGPPALFLGDFTTPRSRAQFARRLWNMAMVGRRGRLTLSVKSEEERASLVEEITELEERVRDNFDVEVKGDR